MSTLTNGGGAGSPGLPRRRRRVLHLVYTMAYGGVETSVINWLRRLDREQFEPFLVCFANPGGTEMPFVHAAEAAGLTVLEKVPWHRWKPVWSAARRVAELVRRHQIDILHSHNCYADVVAWLVRWRQPVKLVTTLYVWGDFGWKRNLLQGINEAVIRRFDLISAHCETARTQTIARGFGSERVKLLLSGFESHRCELTPEERRRRRNELGAGDGTVVLANLARFYPEKAQDGLLRSFREIVARRPEARLWMFGVGPLEADLRRQCRELGLDEWVRFHGFTNDLPGMLALVDIQVHPSHMEGVALSICSGMAAGLPIVASNVGGLPEVLKHDRTGWLVPAGDERGFAEAVLALIEDPERARRLGEGARHFIENEYSLARAVAEVERAYREVLGPCV